MHGVLS